MTRETRRTHSISNAILKHDLNCFGWFTEIDGMIRYDLAYCKNDHQRAGVILEWIKSCEESKSEVVKEEIMKRYNK